MKKESIKDFKKGSIIVIILVIVAIIATGSFVSIKLSERAGKENFMETAQKYLGEKLWNKGKVKEENLGEKSKEEITKETMINTCKKQSEIKNKNACFTGIAIYYKDPSFCEYIDIQEDKDTCQKNTEDYQKAIKERDEELAKLSPEQREQLEKMQGSEYQDCLKQISEKISSMSEEEIKNMSTEEYLKYMEPLYQLIAPSSKLETTSGETGTGKGGGGGVTEDIYELWEERLKENEPYVKEVEALSDNVKIEFTALLQYANYLYAMEGMWSENAKKVMDRVNEIEDENNISDGASQIIMVAVAEDQTLQTRADNRYNELIKQGL